MPIGELIELRALRREMRRVERLLFAAVALFPWEKETMSAALDALKALGVRIDAVTTALAGSSGNEAALEAAVADLTTKVAALEAAAGVTLTEPTPAPPTG